MIRSSRRLAAILLALLLLCPLLPANAMGARDYNSHDVTKLRTFFELTNNMGITNGATIMGSSYNADDPSTWTCCTWNSSGRLSIISFSDKGAVGDLDLAYCTGLTKIIAFSCRLTGINITGCSQLSHIEADHNKIAALDVSGCPKLTLLWIASNKLTELNISNNSKLTRLSCADNTIPELDTAACPLLTYLDCGNNKLTELDLTNCPLITELTCKNNLLTELDVSNLTSLVKFRSLGNMLKSLDISVMNGGEEFVLKARGSGYVGTKCNIDSSGVHTVANAVPKSGSAFYGWYGADDALITEAADMSCALGQSGGAFTALFDIHTHLLTINYVNQDGSEAAPAYVCEVEEEEAYSVVSPVIPGRIADIAAVEGVMGTEDVTVTVTYSIPKHTLRIFYQYENGTAASRTYNAAVEEGAPYNVPSPVIPGYYADPEAVTGVMGTEDITFTVIYRRITHALTVNYVYENGEQAHEAYSAVIPEGEGFSVVSPDITGYTPDMPVVEGVMGEGDMTYTVTYSVNVYNVAFVDWDGSVISSQRVPYGSAAEAPEDPEREGHSFIGWDRDFSFVTEDMTVTALYEIHTFTVVFVDWDGGVLSEQTVPYGCEADEPAEPVREGYTFIGWDRDFSFVTEDMTVTAQYRINTYIVRFNDWDGSLISVQQVEYGSAAEAPEAPVREGYTFIGWDRDFSCVTDNMTVTALYEINVYTVTFVDWDGGVLSEQQVPYGSAAEAPADPVREGWVFIGWDRDFSFVAEDMTVTALYYQPVYHTLTVVYVYEDGSEAAEAYSAELAEGEEYSVPSPVIEGFTADIEVVSGVMGEEDVNITVTYSPAAYHALTIVYVYEDGSEAAEAYSAELAEGEEYSVPSPVIEGFTADIEVVSGVMGEEDVNITVTYSPVPTVLMGDVDGNGVINANDALMLLRYTLGIIPATDQILLAGDYDGNGTINANDALKLLRKSLGII